MKVYYDEEIDALYLKLGEQKPDGVIEIAEGVNIDTTSDGKLTGIEILKASKKININTILSYTLKLDQDILQQNVVEQGAYFFCSNIRKCQTAAAGRVHPGGQTLSGLGSA
jgi:uncharacterized protein YuzE